VTWREACLVFVTSIRAIGHSVRLICSLGVAALALCRLGMLFDCCNVSFVDDGFAYQVCRFLVARLLKCWPCSAVASPIWAGVDKSLLLIDNDMLTGRRIAPRMSFVAFLECRCKTVLVALFLQVRDAVKVLSRPMGLVLFLTEFCVAFLFMAL
jgi:hypothetical protein